MESLRELLGARLKLYDEYIALHRGQDSLRAVEGACLADFLRKQLSLLPDARPEPTTYKTTPLEPVDYGDNDDPEPSADLVERVGRFLVDRDAEIAGVDTQEYVEDLTHEEMEGYEKDARSLCRLLPRDEWVNVVWADESDKRGGWTFNVRWMESLQERIHYDEDLGKPSLETIEEVLKAALIPLAPPAASGEKGRPDEASRRETRYVCRGCGAKWTERRGDATLRSGEHHWVGKISESDRGGEVKGEWCGPVEPEGEGGKHEPDR